MKTTTDARAIDAAVDAVIAGRPPIVERRLRPLVEVAATIRAALPLLPTGAVFNERLARRLHETSARSAAGIGPGPLGLPRAWAGIRSHPRLLVVGAVGSAAVSVAGVTAIAVWRAAHPGRATDA